MSIVKKRVYFHLNHLLRSMKKTDPLFALIQSMSKAEKIFFKKQAATSGPKDQAHVKLFDAMEKLADYDEEKFQGQE